MNNIVDYFRHQVIQIVFLFQLSRTPSDFSLIYQDKNGSDEAQAVINFSCFGEDFMLETITNTKNAYFEKDKEMVNVMK